MISNKDDIYLRIEPEFLYDYLIFGSKIRFYQASLISQGNEDLQNPNSVANFVFLFELHQKALEDLGAFCLAFKRRFNPDADCVYQKHFKSETTQIMFTIINYAPRESNILEIVGDRDEEISGNLNLSLIMKVNVPGRVKWKKEIINSIKKLGKNQTSGRRKLYNKIKHGFIVVGNGKTFKLDQPFGPAAIYSDKPKNSLASDELHLHSFKYEKEEFDFFKENIKTVSLLLRDLIKIYLINIYSDFLRNKKGLQDPYEIFENPIY